MVVERVDKITCVHGVFASWGYRGLWMFGSDSRQPLSLSLTRKSYRSDIF